MKEFISNISSEILIGQILLNIFSLSSLITGDNFYIWFFQCDSSVIIYRIILFILIGYIIGILSTNVGHFISLLFKLFYPRHKINIYSKTKIVDNNGRVKAKWWMIFTFGMSYWIAYKTKYEFFESNFPKILNSNDDEKFNARKNKEKNAILIKKIINNKNFFVVEELIFSITGTVMMLFFSEFIYMLIAFEQLWYLWIIIAMIFIIPNALIQLSKLILFIISQIITLDGKPFKVKHTSKTSIFRAQNEQNHMKKFEAPNKISNNSSTTNVKIEKPNKNEGVL